MVLIYSKLASNLQSTCLSLLSAGLSGIHHNSQGAPWFYQSFFRAMWTGTPSRINLIW